MKPVDFDKKFVKHYKFRIQKQPKLSKQYDSRYALFCNGERGWPLDDHPLGGDKSGLRAFSITGDIRVVYKETPGAYVFLDVGSHNQVY